MSNRYIRKGDVDLKGHKKIEMANFNCTFGENDDPMLLHFIDTIYPAINSSIRRKESNGNQYFIEDVRLYNTKDLGIIMVGLHVLKTKLEVKSIYEEGKGLRATDKKYDSGPYSAFAIILKNHRMIHIRNQKGSPSISSFGKTIRCITNEYIRKKNEKREKSKKLPHAFINITNIPSTQSIDEQFRQIKKIKLVTFRLYPLNGDLEFGEIFQSFRGQLHNTGSKSGNMNINNPKNKTEISNLVKLSSDKVDTTLNAVLLNGTEKRFKNNDFSEKIPVYLPEEEEDIHKNIKNAINVVRSKEEIRKTSDKNQEIYDKKQGKIIDLMRYINSTK